MPGALRVQKVAPRQVRVPESWPAEGVPWGPWGKTGWDAETAELSSHIPSTQETQSALISWF